MKISLIHTRSLYVLLLSCISMIAIFVITSLIRQLFIVDTYKCIAHGISLDYTERIRQVAYNCMKVKKLNVFNTIFYIQQEFPAIDTVFFRFHPDHVLIVVTPHAPLCVINNEKVIVHNGTLIEKSFFDGTQCDLVPFITIPEDSDHKIQFMQQLVQSLGDYHAFFNSVVMNNHQVYLEDKNEKKFAILTTVDTHISEKKMRYCQCIKQQLCDRGVFKKNERWLADIRFADHIIVYRG